MVKDYTPARSKTSTRINTMVKLAILVALMLVLNFTPIGLLRIGPVEITFLQIPVIIGAVIIGPGAGAFLGLVFGFISLSAAPTNVIFAPMLTSLPMWLLAAVVCIVPRVVMGLLSGLLAKALGSFDKTRGIITYSVTGVVGSLLNTVLFLGGVIILLRNYVSDTMYELGLLAEQTFEMFWIAIGATNGVPEAIATGIIVTVICKALNVIYKSKSA